MIQDWWQLVWKPEYRWPRGRDSAKLGSERLCADTFPQRQSWDPWMPEESSGFSFLQLVPSLCPSLTLSSLLFYPSL